MSTEMINSYLIITASQEVADQKANSLWLEKNRAKNLNYLNHPDFAVISSQTSIGIEQIRQLKKQIFKKPYSADTKAIYIPQAEKLTPVSQNALLKTLEEPPKHTIIILATFSPEKILPTVLSRCLVIKTSQEKPVKNQKLTEFWQVLSGKNPGERLLSLEVFTNRQQALDFCQQALVDCRQQLINAGNCRKKITAANCRLLLTAFSQLERNCQPELVLDNLAISWQ